MKRTGLLLLILSIILSACGTVAVPVFQADLEETQVAQAATSDAATANAPTATDIPTATPTATQTPLPTATPTEAPTEAPTDTPVPTEAPTEDESASSNEVTGDPAAGQVLFETFMAQANFACNTCHLVDSEAQLIGPGLQNVSVRGETRVAGLSAVEYIRQSIMEPSAYVVEGYPDMLMPQVYASIFTDAQIDDLVAYLMSL